MYLDFPKISRCCFCFPLRYGLEIWGYIKLICELSFILYAFLDAWSYLTTFNFVTILTVILSLLLMDFIFSILLVVACHVISEKLFKYFYVYSIVVGVMFIGFLLLDLVMLILMIQIHGPYNFGFVLMEVGRNILPPLGMLVIQSYITLLVRTEWQKLRDRSNVQFVNHADDQKVTVNIPIQAEKLHCTIEN